ILGFNPGRVRFITQTEGQGKTVGEAPSVLSETSVDLGGLLPTAARQTAAESRRQTQKEICHAFAGVLQWSGRIGRREVRTEYHAAQLTAVAGVEDGDVVIKELEAKLQRMATANPGDGIIGLPDLAVEALSHEAVADVRQSAIARTGRSSTTEVEAEK